MQRPAHPRGDGYAPPQEHERQQLAISAQLQQQATSIANSCLLLKQAARGFKLDLPRERERERALFSFAGRHGRGGSLYKSQATTATACTLSSIFNAQNAWSIVPDGPGGWQPSRPTFPAQGFGQAEHLGSRAFTELRSSLQDKGFLGPHSLNTQQKRHAPERSTDSGCSRNCSEFLGGGWGGKNFRTQMM